ncbi:tRNA (uracil-5-)-methyltransferase homolog B-like isoform X2 [Lycorma delicatula]|uniref:tRNA (uracil-5-)-methyltransferase homolog B-like isoform X2 n=1 Tax=Lycorma delicatula TaxID=130591 RepID=UPI003F50E3ED
MFMLLKKRFKIVTIQQVLLRQKFQKKTNVETDNIQTLKYEKSICLTVTEENQYELLNDLITPLWKMPYDEQLKKKWRFSRYVLNQFCQSRFKSLCELEDTIASPVTEGYRNKSEMNIRKGVDGNMKTVGGFIGAPGIDIDKVVCVPPTHLINTSERHKQIVKMYQDFIRNSPLPALHNLGDGGYWRGIVIRTNNTTGDTMVITFVHPQNFTDKEIHDNALELKEYFDYNNANLSSLYYQPCRQTRCSNDISPYQLLSGEPYLFETLYDYKFRISPDSFFQINKSAAELLYRNIIKLAQLKPHTVLLDLCCGTGVISILCSSYVRTCIGIDIMAQAVEDARANAKLNNVTNCEFIKGGIVETLPKMLQSLDKTSDIVAVINPTRNGVEPGIIKAIRYCKQITRLVYVSCKADAPNTIKNFNDLCRGNLCTGKRFFVKNITPVDLFPHTDHCELILLFER